MLAASTDSLYDLFEQMGPLRWALLACSIFILAALLDRTWAYWVNSKRDTRSLRARVVELLKAGEVREAARLCATTPGPISAVLLKGMQSYDKHSDMRDRPRELAEIVEKGMDDYSEHAMSAVEKRLAILATLGSAAPLLGMLGTVSGMIGAFGAMATGGMNNAEVSTNISEALTTTAVGLALAVVAIIPYNVFAGMADKINLEIEEAKTEVLDVVATRGKGA